MKLYPPDAYLAARSLVTSPATRALVVDRCGQTAVPRLVGCDPTTPPNYRLSFACQAGTHHHCPRWPAWRIRPPAVRCHCLCHQATNADRLAVAS